ncbi:MAG: histidine kinase [Geodermatophilaceae bacterium]|jgi:two-component system LytT family sensor kinase|nr:histidine kinase [Geodermatophilaceae bacterium]
MQTAVVVLALLLIAGLVAAAVGRRVQRRGFSTIDERVAFRALHTASQAAPPLRMGLTSASAGRSAKYLRELLGAPAIALTDEDGLLTWEGPGEHHAAPLVEAAQGPLHSGRPTVVNDLACGDPDCPVRGAVVVPIAVDERVAGTLIATTSQEPGTGLLRAATETARWVSTQLELAELDRSRAALAQAEVRALRAQISPHFIYNALTAIASFVRTDPERARELLLEFAEFTRYSFRSQGDFTTLAEELHNIERYLTLERARFGDRLQARLQVAPEVLPVAVPFLALQPLVENAVRHGLAGKTGVGTISIIALDAGAECHISVEDDGVGMDPDLLLGNDMATGAEADRDHMGLGNVNDRLRSVFGDDYGLVVETALGAGTKVSMRIPKFAAGVRAS